MIYGSDICIEQVCVVPVRSKGAVDHKKSVEYWTPKIFSCSPTHALLLSGEWKRCN